MNRQSNEELIRRRVDKLVKEYAPRQAILFGSHACGTPNRDSDIDLLIVKETEEPFTERVVPVRMTTRGMHKGIRLVPASVRGTLKLPVD